MVDATSLHPRAEEMRRQGGERDTASLLKFRQVIPSPPRSCPRPVCIVSIRLVSSLGVSCVQRIDAVELVHWG